MRKQTFWFLPCSDTKQAVQLQKMATGLKSGFRKKRDRTIYVAKTKALISFAVTAKLICVFVFAYAKCSFSHDAAHLFCYYYMYVPLSLSFSLVQQRNLVFLYCFELEGGINVCTRNLCFSKNKSTIIFFFHLKFTIFTALKSLHIA